ncbi:MAG: hypothetical protein A2381_13770 [Bdellovibrionales bacterium RIFOXYB1_FULL_37_110]|nr:MAG: hypothetical protein A2417_05405 [Bdellovibrionales bacterium RIFOXYC1_FULL_37_79]OFZ56928.1 MAG: hypothetical protein A2381_13770 [Bdellovibrionales bacterium RIFOXYB1_FULL_37_110]OFZ62015.1 MAG: hypothetical protein A2577_19240 [Bdellovibrionales bacterium RIFOXYD1_FULL_36_51]
MFVSTKNTFILLLLTTWLVLTSCIQPPPASKSAGKFGENAITPRMNLAAGTTTITESNTTINIPVYLDKAGSSQVTAFWRIVNLGDLPTASAFSVTAGTVSISAGYKTGNISLIASDDYHFETNEIVYLEIYNASGAIISDPATRFITVIDNDSGNKPTLFFPTTYAQTTEDATASVNVAVSISAALNVDVDIAYLVYGDASYPADHGLTAGFIHFPRGTTTQYINVPIVADATLENDENIYIELLGIDELQLSPAARIFNLKIVDDEAGAIINFTPPLAVNALESDGAVYATINLSFAHGIDTTINFTASGDATWGADYTASSSITIPAGMTTFTVTFSLINDLKDEYDQTIEYTLNTPSSGTIGANNAFTITLQDDDNLPALTFNTSTSSIVEGQTGYFSRVIPLTLSVASEKIITIDYNLSGTATVNLDYGNFTGFTGTSSGSLTIAAGSTTTNLYYISYGDLIDEDDETIIVDLATASQINVEATGIITHTVTIVDEDLAPTIYFPQTSALVDEDMVTYSVTVSLRTPSQKTITADFSTAAGSASPGGTDYDFPSGSIITFNPGETTTTLLISLVNGDGVEPLEDIVLNLDSITNSVTSSLAAYSDTFTLNIVDTDALAELSFTTLSSTVAENISPAQIGITAILDKISARDTEFDFELSGTATTSAPYPDVLLPSLPIVIPAGSLSTIFTLTMVNDVHLEATEYLTLTATNLTSYATITDIALATYDLTILEDDVLLPQIRFSSASSIYITENATTYSIQIQSDRSFGFDIEAYITLTASETTATSSPTAFADFDWPGSVTGVATITIPAYGTTAALDIELFEDIADEIDPESISFKIDSVSSQATVGSVDTKMIYINDDDGSPSVDFVDVTLDATEGFSFTATVTLNATSAFNVSIPIVINSGQTTATASDYSFTPSTLTILAGSSMATTSLITITDDLLNEATEHLVLQFGTLVNAVAGPSNPMDISLIDNDAQPTIYFTATSTTISETNLDITVSPIISLSATSGQDITVNITSTLTTTAIWDEDYTNSLGTITILAGEVIYHATTTIIGDLTDEPDKQIVYELSAPTNANLGATTEHTIFIIDDEATPSISFSTATAEFLEGGFYNFTINLTSTSEYDITFDLDYNLLTTASMALGVDHTFATGSLTIPAGSLSITSTPFIIISDGFYDEETLVIDLVNPINTATTAPATITATLIDTSAKPIVRMLQDSITLFEPGAGATTTYTVTFSQTAASGIDTEIYYSLSGTAVDGVDFTIAGSPITITEGSTTAYALITILDDAPTIDPAEFFDLQITSVTGASTAAYDSLHVIINDAGTEDASASLTPTVISVAEGATFSIEFKINEPITTDITMSYRLAPPPTSSATPTDISPSAGTVLITSGSTNTSVVFTAINDTLDEHDEIGYIEITGTSTGVISTIDATATVTILDNDPVTRVSFQSVAASVNESSLVGTFTFVLDNVVGKIVSVPYTVAATSTAVNPADHDLVSGTATVSEGNTSVSVTFSIVNDAIDEYNETIIVQMGSPVNATIGPIVNHTLTIIDNDPSPYVDFATTSLTVMENVGVVSIDITLSSTSEKTMTLPYEFGPGTTTTYGLDHDLPDNGSISIPAGVSTHTATFTIIDDTSYENTEVAEITMLAPINLELGTVITASVYIVDNDLPPTVQFTMATSTIQEDTGTARIQFSLSPASGKATTVNYSLQPASTAQGLGVDHNLIDGTIVILAGQTNGYTATIDITDDVLTENPETIVVDLDSAVNASVGALTTHTMTIVDNDQIKVAIGALHTCTLVDGGVYCWGDNTYGQRGMEVIDDAFGDEPGEDLITLTAQGIIDLGSGFSVKQIVAGSYHNCALSTTGLVKCWGLNNEGQLGLGDAIDRGRLGGQMGDNLPTVNLGPDVTATKLSAGEQHTCALLSNQTIKCWGSNNSGNLGQPSILNLGTVPNDIFNINSILFTTSPRDVASGSNHNCARFAGPNLECWGENSDGQLGYDHNSDTGGSVGDFTPANYVELNGTVLTDMSLGHRHTCILAKSTSEAKCFGENAYGQLGLGDTTNRGDTPGDMLNLNPLPLPSGLTITKVTSGYNHNCMLYSNNRARCFGRNDLGQLGADDSDNWGDNPTETASNAAVININGSTVMTDLFSGGNHNCGAIDSRTVKCWGNNSSGQLLTEDTVPYGSSVDTVTNSATLGF